MSLVKAEKKEKSVVWLEVSVDRETFAAACEKAYKKNAGKFKVQGFRPGKAPKKFIEKIYGESVFYEDAVNLSYAEPLRAAIDEAGLEQVAAPELELLDVGPEGYTFKAVVTVKPEVTMGEYKGLEAEYEPTEVTDTDVDAELERRRVRASRQVDVDRPIVEGDTAVIDYEGFVDGVPFEGGKGEKHPLKIGSGQFIPGFEEQLIGKKTGEDAEVSVTFPEEYHAENLKGKAATFKVLVHEVKETELPDLDDEFAKDISEFETLDELKKDIRERMTANNQKTAQDEFEGKIIDKIIEGMQVEVPDAMVEGQLDRTADDFGYRLQSQGMTLESYFKMTGTDMETFRKNFRDQAERQVKVRLAFEKVIELEGLSVTDEDIETEYEKMAESYKMNAEDVKKYITTDAVRQDLKIAKATEFIRDNSVKTAPETENKTAKKKPAAKKAAEPGSESTGEEAPKKKAAARKKAADSEEPKE